MTLNKIRIAFVGTFDLPNYGDHIFPIIFREKLMSSGLDIELVLYSIEEKRQALGQDNWVYSVKDLEKNHLENSYTAIVIAGGGIIHFRENKQKINDRDSMDYSYSELWGLPTYIANKYKIKLIWNAPEVPYQVEKELVSLFKSLTSEVGLLAVRDETSRDLLVDQITMSRAKIVPDTGLLLSEVLPKETIKLQDKFYFLTPEKYVVFHIATSDLSLMSDEEQQQIIAMLKAIEAKGFKVVLVPLAFTFEDEKALDYINVLADNRFHLSDTPYTFSEILSLIGNSYMYIGVSLHGSMTALEYGKKAVAFDKIGRKKVRDLYESILDCKWYTTDVMNLASIVSEAFEYQEPANLVDVRERLELYFVEVLEYLKSNVEIPKKNSDLLSETTKTVSKFDANLKVTHQYMLQVTELEKILPYQEKVISSYEHEKQKLLRENHELITDKEMMLNEKEEMQYSLKQLQGMYEKTLRFKIRRILQGLKRIFKV